jgi:hypothetical protein
VKEKMIIAHDVKEQARNAIWHLRMAADAIEHSIPSLMAATSGSAEETPENVKQLRLHCRKIFAELYGKLGTAVSTLSDESLKESLRELCNLCDERSKELNISLRDQLELQGRELAEAKASRKPEEKKPQGMNEAAAKNLPIQQALTRR